MHVPAPMSTVEGFPVGQIELARPAGPDETGKHYGRLRCYILSASFLLQSLEAESGLSTT